MVKEKAMRRFGMVLGLGLCGIAPIVALAQQQGGANWSYEGKQGPLNWGRLDPAYRACALGKEQSPIDIRGAHLNKNLQPIEFHYVSGAMTLTNTGHTVQVTPPAGSYIVAGGTRYDLVQFHFHHPGEEAVKGKLPDMTIHLVHKSSDGKFAVVAIRLNEGNANAVLASLWAHLPKTVGATEKLTESMSPAGLLPTDRGYWTYEGSLTAPPCTEGVRWFVFEQQVEVSRDQLRSFAALYKVDSRMVQPTHGRKVEASE
jgi:carbonic anhydrase